MRVGAIPLAYVIIVLGALIHNKGLVLRTDLLYRQFDPHAYPIQQLLVMCGLAFLNPGCVGGRCSHRHPAREPR